MEITQEYNELFSSLMNLIRSSNSLYSLDVDFMRSVNRGLADRSRAASCQLLDLINDLINKCNGGSTSINQPLQGPDDIVNRWRSIEQTFDLLFDKVDSPPSQASEKSTPPSASEGNPMRDFLKMANNIPKPQLEFHTKVDNSLRAFKPLLTSKPHATFTKLKKCLKAQEPDEEHGAEWYEQPYKREIAESPYPPYNPESAIEKPDWESTPFTYVDTPKKLFKMVSKLDNATEIAVDVEHHDYRTYLGLVCLLQISALGEDYVVDALLLRSELQILNRVFADPNIVKVFHGAKMDIMWLQRDLGVYVVNLFDTHFAMRELQFPKHSLAYLLEHYVSFTAQKKYQLADWRYRPLPQELIDYARADTHFLLYIYHQLRRQLDAVGKTEAVLEASRGVASYRYEYPGWNVTEPAWVQFAIKYRLNGQLQRAVLVKLFEWRDKMARKYDESPRYVMSPQFLANLCITKPNSKQGVHAASHNISKIVRQHEDEIVEIIQDACNNPDSVDTTIPDRKVSLIDSTSPINTSETGNTTASVSICDLKLDESNFMGKSQPITNSQRKPLITLCVYEPQDLEKAKKYNEALAKENEASQAQKEAAAREAEAIEQEERMQQLNELQQRSRSEQDQYEKLSGKRLNITGDTDEFELTTKINNPNSRKRVADEPAFDFQNATSVLRNGNESEQKSFSRFGSTFSGPKGAHKNTSKFKKAKSFRR